MGKNEVLVLNGIICVSQEASDFHKPETRIMYGTFSQEQWREILERRSSRLNPPLFEVHTFEGNVENILPDDQLAIQGDILRRKNNFLDENSCNLFNAREIVMLG
jgi:hypothetical protein